MKIIDQIIHLNDDRLIMEINSLLLLHNSESEIQLSPTQMAKITESEAQIAAGQFNESMALWNKVDSWLDQK